MDFDFNAKKVMEEVGEHNKASDTRKKLVLRHFCKTNFIGALNERLNTEQKTYIDKTVFGWLLCLPDCIKIGRNLLAHLCGCWVENMGGFYIGDKVIGFTEFDVCMSLGLPVLGEMIDLNKVGHRCVCRDYFPDGKVDVKMVYEFLLEERENFCVEQFCSLYILVGISAFLLPNRSGLVFPVIFDLVSELGSLGKYSWDSLVFHYFIQSVCNVSTSMKNDTTRSNFHVEGCAYLLQVWFCHHFVTSKSMYSTRVTKFPRLLNWIGINIGEKFIATALAKGSVVVDVGVSKEEPSYGVVKDVVQKHGFPYYKQNRGETEKLFSIVDEQTRVVADMRTSIGELKKSVEAINEHKSEDFVEQPFCGSEGHLQSTPIQDDHQTPMVDGGIEMKQTTMYDQMKAAPRKWIKSVARSTPYTEHVTRKK